MSINLTDELLAKTKKGKIASAKQVFLEGDKENLQQIGDKTHQLEDAVKDITVSGGASTANAVSYNNETSGMTAVTAQGAIDELATKNKAQDAIIETKAEKSEVATELDKKFDKESILQESGNAEDKVMSQKAVSDKLSDLSSKVGKLYGEEMMAITFIEGNYYNNDGTFGNGSGKYTDPISLVGINKIIIKNVPQSTSARNTCFYNSIGLAKTVKESEMYSENGYEIDTTEYISMKMSCLVSTNPSVVTVKDSVLVTIDELAAKNATKAEKAEVTAELDKKFDKESILQESGNAEDKVMSQKAVSDKLSDLSSKVGKLYGEEMMAITFIEGNYYNNDGTFGNGSGKYTDPISLVGINKIIIKNVPQSTSARNTCFYNSIGLAKTVKESEMYSENGYEIDTTEYISMKMSCLVSTNPSVIIAKDSVLVTLENEIKRAKGAEDSIKEELAKVSINLEKEIPLNFSISGYYDGLGNLQSGGKATDKISLEGIDIIRFDGTFTSISPRNTLFYDSSDRLVLAIKERDFIDGIKGYFVVSDYSYMKMSCHESSSPKLYFIDSSVRKTSLINNPHLEYLYNNFLFIGDSNTAGHIYDYPRTPAEGIASRVLSSVSCFKRMTESNVENGGFSGFSAKDWYHEKINAYDYTKYDSVFIELGYNKGLTDTLATDVEPYSSYQDYADTETGNYCKIIETILASNPTISIVLVKSPYLILGGQYTTYITLEKIATKYNLPTINLQDCAYINLNDLKYHGLTSATDGYNMAHFNSIGYTAKADLLLHLFREQMNSKSQYFVLHRNIL